MEDLSPCLLSLSDPHLTHIIFRILSWGLAGMGGSLRWNHPYMNLRWQTFRLCHFKLRSFLQIHSQYNSLNAFISFPSSLIHSCFPTDRIGNYTPIPPIRSYIALLCHPSIQFSCKGKATVSRPIAFLSQTTPSFHSDPPATLQTSMRPFFGAEDFIFRLGTRKSSMYQLARLVVLFGS